MTVSTAGNKKTKKPKNSSGAQSLDLPDASVLERSASLFKTLSNPHRLLILMLLKKKGELDVQHIQEALKISQPLASQHLKALKQQGLLVEHRQGKHVFYSLKTAAVSNALLGVFQLQAAELALETESLATLNEMLSMWIL